MEWKILIAKLYFRTLVSYSVNYFCISLQNLIIRLDSFIQEIENGSRVHLWCDSAREKCWENTREACKTRGVEKNNTAVPEMLGKTAKATAFVRF